MARAASERSPAATPFVAARGAVLVWIRLVPQASANRIMGTVSEGDGGVALKVSVTAAPERGKANAALVALLAREWRLPKSALTIAADAGLRRKTVRIDGDSATLLAGLEGWYRRSGLDGQRLDGQRLEGQRLDGQGLGEDDLERER
jgi:hypothetical protein